MSAKEMFEALGYKLVYKNKYEVKYKKPYEVNQFLPKEFASFYEIVINFGYKTIYKKGSYMTFDELKAINKQIEELGWLEDV